MNEMNERRSSAEIVAEWRAELEIHDREAQDGDRTWHFTHYIRADPEMFIRAALRELDRLTAERDAARAELAELRNVIGILTFNMRDVSNMLIGMCQQYAYLKIAPDIESEASE